MSIAEMSTTDPLRAPMPWAVSAEDWPTIPRIIATADLHGNLPDIPPCDILVIAGDICPDGTEVDQLYWLDSVFRRWLLDNRAVPADHVIGIAGNHDFAFEKCAPEIAAMQLPWHYLQDSAIKIRGVRFYGLPWVPNLKRWAFYGDDAKLAAAYAAVPVATDVVISHGPPWYCGDLTCPMFDSAHVGAPAANMMMRRVHPQAFVCGHIHEGYGHYYGDGVDVYNVSYVDENYRPGNPPVEIGVL